MEEAIGSQITYYMIKPVKPHHILLTLKKIIDNKRLVQEKTSSAYQQEFQKIFMAVQSEMDHKEWADIYKKLVFWELNLEKSKTSGMKEVFSMQKSEANREFSKFISKNYIDWIHNEGDAPLMSHTIMKSKILPEVKPGKPTFFFLIDNLRYDQWRVLHPMIAEDYRLKEENVYYSILPTATQYSRNALFAGMMPLEIERKFPKYWKNDEEEGGKNLHEADFFTDLLARTRSDLKWQYEKITSLSAGQNLVDNISNYLNNDLTIIVYNFVDMLSHARTDMEVLKELANDEAAYRSLTLSWFDHSPLYQAIKKLADKDINLVISTDHGTVRVNTPSKVLGDRNTTTNLRYKTGKNLQFNPKEVFEIKDPHKGLLPKQHVSSNFIFAKEDEYFVYPNNYNYYVNYYRNTFQHGGISLEEVLIPYAIFTSK